MSDVFEIFENIDEKQKFLTIKANTLEEMVTRLTLYVEKKAGEFQDNTEISDNFNFLKTELGSFYKEFEEVGKNFASLNKKIGTWFVAN